MRKSIIKISRSEEETRAIAGALAKHLDRGNIICLVGDLGAGKTTFVKGLAQGMRINPREVCSPSYVLMNIYKGKKMSLFHFDLYRLDNLEEIHTIGYDEFLYGEDVSVIEWAQRLKGIMPEEYLSVEMIHQGINTRKLKITAVGTKYLPVIEHVSHEITLH